MKKCSKYLSLLLALVCLLMSFAGCRFDLLVGDLSLPGSADPSTQAPVVETTLPQQETTTLPATETTTLPTVEQTTLPPAVEQTTLPPAVEQTTLPPVVETTLPAAKTPDTMSNQELLDFFNSSLNALKANKVGLTRSKLTTIQDLVLSNSLANSLVGMVKGMLFSEETEYASAAKGQSNNDVLSPSGQTFASALTLNDIKSINVQKNGNNYVITVVGVDCANPTSASPCAKVFDYLTLDDVMNVYVPKVGATVAREDVSVSFKNSSAVLTVSADGVVSGYETHTYNYLTMKNASIKKGVTISTDLDVTLYTVTKFYDFQY